eukprot:TRINITY_DN65846_c8_g15_i1.p1 TRINITY_DN65846_c8_g15~~TRINITY_DN65846_c8_g15_i1.p1  ORF type:complete len:850 (+),score=454.44 TRINITY_DN65846_c8_g15_i1:192-2552(+)
MAVSAGIVLRKNKLLEASMAAQRRSAALLKLFAEMSHVSQHSSLLSVIDRILRVAYEVLECDRVTLFFVSRGRLFSLVSKDAQGFSLPIGEGIAGTVAQTARTMNVEDAYECDLFESKFDRLSGYCTKSVLCSPVISNQRHQVIAVVQAINKRADGGNGYSQYVHSMNKQAGVRDAANNVTSVGASASQRLPHNARQNAATNKANRLSTDRHWSSESAMPDESDAVAGSLSASSSRSRSHPSGLQLSSSSSSNALDVGDSDDDDSGSDDQRTAGSSVVPGVRRASSLGLPAVDCGRVTSPQSDSAPTHARRRSELVPMSTSGSTHMLDTEAQARRRRGSNAANPVHIVGKGMVGPGGFNNALLSASGSLQRGLDRMGSVIGEDEFVAFDEDDITLLESLCKQISAIVQRYHTEVVLARVPLSDEVHSFVELCTSRRAASMHLSRSNSTLVTSQFEWPASSVASSPHLEELDDMYSFNVFSYSAEELLQFALMIFHEMGLIGEFNISPQRLKRFLVAIRLGYHEENAYHNFRHGWSVFHFVYLTLRRTRAKQFLTSLDVLALLVAALGHDVDHPGNTNSFEVNTRSELAMQHNDVSVLENHHACVTYRILSDDNCNIFAGIPGREAQQELRTVIIHAILATDMALHFDDCRRLRSLHTDAPFDRANQKERQLLVNIMLHTADLSAQVFPTPIATMWEDCVVREFIAQAERERELGLPVAPCTVGLTDPLKRAALQVNFIDVLLDPWWDGFVRLFPNMSACYAQLMHNRDYYHRLSQDKTHSNNSNAS